MDINISAWVLWYVDIVLSFKLLILLLYLGSVTAGVHIPFPKSFQRYFYMAVVGVCMDSANTVIATI
jgi:hypothetical protein